MIARKVKIPSSIIQEYAVNVSVRVGEVVNEVSGYLYESVCPGTRWQGTMFQKSTQYGTFLAVKPIQFQQAYTIVHLWYVRVCCGRCISSSMVVFPHILPSGSKLLTFSGLAHSCGAQTTAYPQNCLFALLSIRIYSFSKFKDLDHCVLSPLLLPKPLFG